MATQSDTILALKNNSKIILIESNIYILKFVFNRENIFIQKVWWIG